MPSQSLAVVSEMNQTSDVCILNVTVISVLAVYWLFCRAEITTVEGIFTAVESGLQLMQAQRQVALCTL